MAKKYPPTSGGIAQHTLVSPRHYPSIQARPPAPPCNGTAATPNPPFFP